YRRRSDCSRCSCSSCSRFCALKRRRGASHAAALSCVSPEEENRRSLGPWPHDTRAMISPLRSLTERVHCGAASELPAVFVLDDAPEALGRVGLIERDDRAIDRLVVVLKTSRDRLERRDALVHLRSTACLAVM